MNSKGFTFIELLVASVIVMSGLWGIMSVVSFANRTEMIKTRASQKDAIVYNLMQELRKKPESLQLNFSGAAATTLLTNQAGFPIAFDYDRNATDVANCTTCRGRMGYVVQPLVGYSDFYLTSIRICTDYTDNTTCEFFQMYMVTK